MIINVAIAFFIAVLSGLGIGGGGLFAVYLCVVGKAPQLLAQGLNLTFFIFAAGASVAVGIKKRRISYRLVGLLTLGGAIGVLLGVWLGGVISENYLRRLFGIMLMTGGIISLRGSLSKSGSEKSSAELDSNGRQSPKNDSKRAEK